MAGERTLTASLSRLFGNDERRRGLRVGIGDDAAVVRPSAGHDQVLCCDPVVEGTHFERGTKPALIGRKAVNRNLSDLAAMGAVAQWLLVSVVAPRDRRDAELRALLRGARRAADAAGATVIGGDLANGDGPLVVTVTACGYLPTRPLTRDGARVGDQLFVSGPLGGSEAGHHLRFRPALAEGQWLARQPAVRAAIDVSDGLLLDLSTMLESSGVAGAELDAHMIPITAAARRLAGGDRDAALRRACGDGEDHVLLWVQRRGTVLAAGGPLTARARRAIGRVIDEPGLWLRTTSGRRRLPVTGYQHRWRTR